MKIIIYKTETGIATISPCKDYETKIFDSYTPAVTIPATIAEDGKTITPAKVVSPAKEVSHMELIKGIDLALRAVPEGSEYKIVEYEEIPQDPDFMDALNYDLTFDIEKAKEIKKNKLRAEREILFNINDDKRKIAVRRGEPVEEIDAEAERLCDVPQKVDGCKTLEEIRGVTI